MLEEILWPEEQIQLDVIKIFVTLWCLNQKITKK
jgi:hypothetical protein